MITACRFSIDQPLMQACIGNRLPLPERRNGIFVGVVAEVAFAQNEGGAVGLRQLTRRMADERGDGFEIAGQRQPLHHRDQLLHAANVIFGRGFGKEVFAQLPLVGRGGRLI